jgi:outer membrane protein assembly factor BamB
MAVTTKSRSLILFAALWAPLVESCGDRYTGPWRDPSAGTIPSFADSAFGVGSTKWFAARTFDSVMAAGLDAQSIYTIEAKGATNSLVALNITNGAQRWTKTVPALSHHIVTVGGTAAAVGQGVVGFNATTGDSAFLYAPLSGRTVTSNGATDGAVIVIGNKAGEIVGLNPSTGVESWSVPLDTAPVKGVTVSGGVAYAAGNGFLAAVTIATGVQKWKRPTTDTIRPYGVSAPAVDSNRVTISTLNLNGTNPGMANYDAATGIITWAKGTYPTQSMEAPGQPACSGIVTTNSTTALDAIAFGAGIAVWSKSLNPFSLLSSSCSYGTVIVNARLGTAGQSYNDVQILNASDGAVKAQYPKTSGQHLRVHRVVRNAGAIYFFTATGIATILAP